jgi:hypothetical protein
LGNPEQNTKSSLIRKVDFMFEAEVQNLFLAVAFFKSGFESGF